MYAQYMPTQSLLEVLIGNKAEKLRGLPARALYGMTACEELAPYGLTNRESEKVLAAVEIGKRLASAQSLEKIHLGNPKDVARYLMPLLRYKQQEEMWVLTFDVKNALINKHIVASGSINNLIVKPREIFLKAILDKASAIVIAHNHPSGNPNPSILDNEITESIYKAGDIMSILVMDHIIIGDGSYYSFQEAGFLDKLGEEVKK